jgi:hypothetical protein
MIGIHGIGPAAIVIALLLVDLDACGYPDEEPPTTRTEWQSFRQARVDAAIRVTRMIGEAGRKSGYTSPSARIARDCSTGGITFAATTRPPSLT